jgi:hypothetical protein
VERSTSATASGDAGAELDRLLPQPDVRERFETVVQAPAPLVLEAAASFDMQSLPLVRAVFRLRELLLGARRTGPRRPQGLLEETRALGWGVLAAERDRFVICGAACQPWLADVRFHALPAGQFAAYSVPEQVKIAWSLEVEPLGPATTRLAQETRATATDAVARSRFRRYWRWARFGIVAIRLLMLPAVRRAAERRWAAVRPAR